MLSLIFNTLLYKPFYNALVLLAALTGGDIGFAVIILTVLVRTILLPLTHKQMDTQKKMKLVEGEMAEIKKKHTDKQEQARQMMELYKRHGINPLSGFVLIAIQIPILLALYFVMSRGLPFSADSLYNFVRLPGETNLIFLNILDLTAKSYWMALLVGLSQFVQIRLSLPPSKPTENSTNKTFAEEMARSMNTNMRYVMPVMIALISASLPSVIGLYWLTSNVYSIAHELLVRRKAKEILPNKV